MKKTILITGASSGLGKEAAIKFQKEGWNVIATMRNTVNEQELSLLQDVMVTRLDVLDVDSIKGAVEAGIQRFGKIDVLLNNAGYGAYGPLESFRGKKSCVSSIPMLLVFWTLPKRFCLISVPMKVV